MAKTVLEDLYEAYLTPRGSPLEGKSNPFIPRQVATPTPPPAAKPQSPPPAQSQPEPEEEQTTVQLAGPSQPLAPSPALASAAGASLGPVATARYTGGPMDLGGYYAAVRQHESGGNPNASSGIASGLYQFTMPTWLGVGRAHPELGLTAANINDPARQNAAMKILTADNMKFLQDNGVDPSPKNTFMTHFLGSNAPPFIKTMQSAPTAAAAPMFPKEAAANPTVFYNKDGSPRSLEQVYNLQTRNFPSSWGQTAKVGYDPNSATYGPSSVGGVQYRDAKSSQVVNASDMASVPSDALPP